MNHLLLELTAGRPLAAGFANPALLGGLGLVALPIIIHLLSRRQYRRIEWGATRFLLEAEKENRRRVRFEQWLLLALRCLVMALLALLVARPFVQPGALAALLGTRGAVARILVLDDSASLGHRLGNTADFSRVREAAGRLLSWLQQEAPGEPVSVYVTSRPDEPLLVDAALSEAVVREARQALDRLSPTAFTAEPAALLGSLAQQLAAAGRASRADIYVLSDFQRSDWLPPGAAGVFAPFARLESGSVRVVLIAASDAARENAGLVGVAFERPQTLAGLPAVVQARIANFAARPVSGQTLAVEVDGAPQPGVAIEPLAPGDERVVSVEVSFAEEGFRELSIALATPDALPADDRRRVAVRVKPLLPVLLVNGQPAIDEAGDEVRLLRNALAPPGPLGSGIRVDVIEPDEIEATNLESYDAIMLCNVAAPTDAANDALSRFVRRGGGLAIFVGSEVGNPAEYNRLFHADGAGLLPLPLVALADGGPRGAGVGMLRATAHPVTAMFPADADSLADSARFRTYYRVSEPAAPDAAPADHERPAAVVLARFADADRTPALIERPFGRGRVLLFTSSVDLDWNDWARGTDGSYVVTMLELAQYISRRDDFPADFTAGQPIVIPVWPELYELSGEVRSPRYPDEAAVATTVVSAGDSLTDPALLGGPRAAALGTYRLELRTRGGAVEERPLPVNLSPAESDLASASKAELAASLAGIPHEYVTSAEAFLQDAEQTRRELWPSLLLLLVGALMLEQALAWWFGTPRRSRANRSAIGGVEALRRPG